MRATLALVLSLLGGCASTDTPAPVSERPVADYRRQRTPLEMYQPYREESDEQRKQVRKGWDERVERENRRLQEQLEYGERKWQCSKEPMFCN